MAQPTQVLPSPLSGAGGPGIDVQELAPYTPLRVEHAALRLVHDLDAVVNTYDPNGVAADTYLPATIVNPWLPYPQTLVVNVRTTTTEALAATDTIRVRVTGTNGRGRDIAWETGVMACVATTAANNDSNVFYLPMVMSYIATVEIAVSGTLAVAQRAIDVGISNEWTYTDTTGLKHRFGRNHGIGLPWSPVLDANQPHPGPDVLTLQLERTSGTAFIATLRPGAFGASNVNAVIGDLETASGLTWLDDRQKVRIAASTAVGDAAATIPNHTTTAQAIAAADVMYLRMVGRSPIGTLPRPSSASSYPRG